MRGLFVVQRRFGALELGAQGRRFLLSALECLSALLQLRVELLLGLRDDGLGLVVQAPSESADQVLQCVADGDLGTEALPFLLLQFLPADSGLRQAVLFGTKLPCAATCERVAARAAART